MQKRITQRDVAAHARVSQAAVSRVMGGHGYVAGEVRERVLRAAEEIGYRPDPVARSLITGRSDIVAVVVGHVANPLFPQMLGTLTARLRAQGQRVLLFNAAPGQEIDELLPDALRYRLAGIVILAAELHSRAAAICAAAEVPAVFLHRYPEGGGVPAIACDGVAGGRAAVGELVRTGCRRIAYVGGSATSSPDRDRRRGFALGMEGAGIAPVACLDGAFTYDWGAEAMRMLMRSVPGIDGIFCGDDVIACGVMDAARHELGLGIPRDLSVIGFDDVPQAAWSSYDLTTIRQPLDAMIGRAIEVLGAAEPGARGVELVAGSLVRRASTRG
ncbi:LacI family DNA-binding transcriptional regulator [Palleronia sp. LCG004]|uniref:LacI family DNA-binding transcriptional regulator n=1 Tax=Palleronia sp. LCG004 TaxID=3079304 RepID=UPI0029425A2D|nr:LacI family DNA-binding transcriptional regulator [Palleronia sp. LCG004]WOI57839.1 LacI family DNA-binding transcriptional regulator [Palleronia sp. LCG004]